MKETIMRKLLIGAAFTALAIPGAAQAGETYIGVSAGLSMPGNSANSGQFDSDVPATPDFGAIPAGTDLGWKTEFDNGFAISGQVGHAFDNGLRVELELAYSKYDVDTHSNLTVGGANIDGADVAVLTRGTPDPANPTVGAVIADGQGDVSNFGAFLNVFYDINAGGKFTPYVGAGLGYQSVDVDYQPSGVPVGKGDDDGLAWQAIIGLSFAMSEQFDLFAQYNYRASFDRADIELSLLPATLGVKSKQSTVSAGVRYRFGK
jgi:opacity protein-like surface antigen